MNIIIYIRLDEILEYNVYITANTKISKEILLPIKRKLIHN